MRRVVDAVDEHVHVAIVIEIAESAAARGRRLQNSRPGVVGHVREPAVAQVAVEHLALPVALLVVGLSHFRVHVAVHRQNVRPAVVVEIEEPHTPAHEAGVAAESGLKGGVLEEAVARIAIQAGGVAG